MASPPPRPCSCAASSSIRPAWRRDLTPTSLAYNETIKQAAAYFARHGASAVHAQHQAIAWLGQTLMNQAAFLSYIDLFAVLSLAAAVLVPAAFLLQRVDLRAPPRSAPSH